MQGVTSETLTISKSLRQDLKTSEEFSKSQRRVFEKSAKTFLFFS
jgi:hypothetical protein